jgi:hypothetical protein
LIHTPSGYTGDGLVYRINGKRKKLTLGNTKWLSLGEARKITGQYRNNIEVGADPHDQKIEGRRREGEQRRQEYFSDADIVEQWIEERCLIDKAAVTPTAILFESHDDWAQNAGV